MPTIASGLPCPDFALPEADGGTVTRDGLKGSPFVLFFFPKVDTSGCTTEALDFTRLRADFEHAGVKVFGVSPDPLKKQCRFRDKHGLGVGLLADEERSLLEAFGVWVEKSMYGRKYMGVERTTVLVDAAGDVLQVWPKVSVSGHADEVLKAAQAATTAR